MGSDDLFSKRRQRNAGSLSRVKKDRALATRYLIVCEGTKTEPQYFQAMVAALGINPQWVKVAPNDGNTPDRIVNHALQLYENDFKLGDGFDQVYCVFDRDTHSTFDAAVAIIKELKAKRKPFEAITSTPCFEYWLLLHFEFTDKAFIATGKKSAGDAVVSALKRHMPRSTYEKGRSDIYDLVRTAVAKKLVDDAVISAIKKQIPLTPSEKDQSNICKLVREEMSPAIRNAQRNRASAKSTGSTNPWTNVDELVEAILKVAP